MELQVEGPIIDEETDVRTYRVYGNGDEVSFAVIPRETEDGLVQWIMEVGPNTVFLDDFNFVPYEFPQQAFEAGMRASELILNRKTGRE